MTFTSDVPRDAGEIPISSTYDKNTNTFPALQSGTKATDSFGNDYAPMMTQISNATALGQQTMANSISVVHASDEIQMLAAQQYTANGQSFIVASNSFTTDSGGSGHYAFLAIFNPIASGHSLLVTRFSVWDTQSAVLDVINALTTDPVLANSSAIVNCLVGGGQSPVFTSTYNVITSSYPGTTVETSVHAASVPTEVLNPGQFFILPQGSGIAYGLNVTAVASHNWNILLAVTQL